MSLEDAIAVGPAMLAVALALDAALGEPDWLWRRVRHPIVAIGGAISWLDRSWNHGSDRRRRILGVLAVTLWVGAAVVLGWALAHAPIVGPLIEMIGAAVLLAHRSLVDHVGAVATALRASLAEGRRAVALIVGRDPETLDEAGVARAAVESCAENFSDGVVAPAFWFLVGGLPGMLVYKVVNTADSMVGHRTPRHEAFGWASARLDDALNWIPARLAGVLIAAAAGSGAATRRALHVMWRDARKHKSPNAGWPEAATGAVLGLSLAGPRRYAGVLTDDPHLFAEGRRDAGSDDIAAAVRLVWRAWAIGLGLCLLAALAIGL